MPNPLKLIKTGESILATVVYLLKTNAPLDVVAHFVANTLKQGATQHFRQAQAEFRATAQSLKLSNDWFSGKIPFWLMTFHEYQLHARPNINALEIGSWEGLSSYFVLQSLQNATLTSVDTWEGADEHKSGDAATKEVLSQIEQNFDANLSKFKNRLIKRKGTSFSYFQQNTGQEKFDLIYVDGSHYCDDVVIDAIKCFELLNVGGLMIFDDYLWQYYPRAIDNPAAAINAFLRLKKGSYKIVRVYYQIIIEKTVDQRELRSH